MKGLGRTHIWSHQSIETDREYSNRDIRKSTPLDIRSYPNLVRTIAKIQFQNPSYRLFFRGQNKDYKLQSQATSMYPTIYRKKNERLRKLELNKRRARLSTASNLLIQKFEQNNLFGHSKLKKFPELCWAILQHYEVCDTPLLDLTQSIRAAASFALQKSSSGYIYVLGFPFIHGSISYYVDSETIIIRLISTCPPEAERPYFQEGYLVGSFPSNTGRKHPSKDVASRLIAKFKIGGEKFWNRDFQPFPNNSLFPKNDVVDNICQAIRETLNNQLQIGLNFNNNL